MRGGTCSGIPSAPLRGERSAEGNHRSSGRSKVPRVAVVWCKKGMEGEPMKRVIVATILIFLCSLTAWGEAATPAASEAEDAGIMQVNGRHHVHHHHRHHRRHH
jgi:hypothetical protein